MSEVNSIGLCQKSAIKAIVTLSINKTSTDALLTTISSQQACHTLVLTTIEQCPWVNRMKVMENMQNILLLHIQKCPLVIIGKY